MTPGVVQVAPLSAEACHCQAMAAGTPSGSTIPVALAVSARVSVGVQVTTPLMASIAAPTGGVPASE